MRGLAPAIAEAARERGEPVPGTVGETPEIWGFALPYWTAFWFLNNRRVYGVGMSGGLPFGLPGTEIAFMGKLHGFGYYDLEFIEILDAMDVEWLTIQTEARSKPSPKPR